MAADGQLFPVKTPNNGVSITGNAGGVLAAPVLLRELPQEIAQLIQSYQAGPADLNPNQPMLKVNNATSILAFVYERIRVAMEYKDDCLLRRLAIERILRRRYSTDTLPAKIALPLLRELIRARYLKNDRVPEAKVGELALIIAKYQRLMQEVLSAHPSSDANRLNGWLTTILSAEIDGAVALDPRREALVEVMYRFFDKNLKEKGKIDEESRRLQLYIGVHRALLKTDDAMLRFRLLEFYFPEWVNSNPTFVAEGQDFAWTEDLSVRIRNLAENLGVVNRKIEEQLESQTGLRLLYFLKKHTAPFLILRDVVEENPGAALERFKELSRLEETVRRICRKRYEETKSRVRRMVVRAVIYVFLTKMAFGLLLELPADTFIYKKVAVYPLLINALFPPFLMFLIATTVHVPGEENTRIILLKIRAILFGDPYFQEGDRALTFAWQPPARGAFLLNSFRVIYLAAFIITFGTIITVLHLIGFNPVSITIFLFFLSVVALFGYAIRRSALELATVGRGENLLTPFVDFFFLPILRMGRYLSMEIARWNFLTYFFDFIIEAPLKSFIEIAEEWLTFVKEKKEELA